MSNHDVIARLEDATSRIIAAVNDAKRAPEQLREIAEALPQSHHHDVNVVQRVRNLVALYREAEHKIKELFVDLEETRAKLEAERKVSKVSSITEDQKQAVRLAIEHLLNNNPILAYAVLKKAW